MLDLSKLPRLNKEAVEQLHKDYSRNYLVHVLNIEKVWEEIEEVKEWFVSNGYDDPTITPANNEVFKSRAEESLVWREVDKLDIQNKAELIKTAYTNKFLKLQELMAQEVESPKEIVNITKAINTLSDIIEASD